MCNVEVKKVSLGVKDIFELIPHRFPFLLVDKVSEIAELESAKGIKAFSYNEYFFQGHFPESPVVPGVLLVESLAQLAVCCVSYSLKYFKQMQFESVALMTVDSAKFRVAVVPGDLVNMSVRKVNEKMLSNKDGKITTVYTFSGYGLVGDKKAFEASFKAIAVFFK
ncbi:3-hydroxyacyl-ACP dehydratase FabZ [Candidatus Nesciobacter abundans]|uniref:3-hydroxyacyl-[acyl-carrier-protein] dehydratase FabZ n=1 Tax=Candidatus Nesciobacter abundans TaxID=2601668 RepID=A0A5C0UGK4_9PROT|nr:3-hydroxyacyl-ACP dehydratase FabZ [Candidatus Nesciobacter abundans]QEK38860.1 3-hydroxyacyl-ACP dehydratase FabZ [Candidatus Nesciobacter abundans]